MVVTIGKYYICDDCEYKWQSKKSFGEPAFCPKCKSNSIKMTKFSRPRVIETTNGLFTDEVREVKDMGGYYLLTIHKLGLFKDHIIDIKIRKNDYEKIEKYNVEELIEALE